MRVRTAVTFLVAVLMVGAGVLVGRMSSDVASKPRAAAAVCRPSATIQCPSPEFLAGVDQLTALNEAIKRARQAPEFVKLQSLVDQAQGVTARLRQQIPAGFGWNDADRDFVKVAAPAAPAPAPAPEKKK